MVDSHIACAWPALTLKVAVAVATAELSTVTEKSTTTLPETIELMVTSAAVYVAPMAAISKLS